MQRRQFTRALTALVLVRAGGLALLGGASRAFALDESQASSGVRAALERGAASAVSQLGRPGGFLDDKRVRIPLPGALNSAASMLRAIGQQKRVDDLIAALAALGETGETNDVAVQTLLNESSGVYCHNMAKLNLYQCLAVAKPYYEDAFCLGQHVLIDTGQCVAQGAGVTPPPLVIDPAAAAPKGSLKPKAKTSRKAG